MKKERLKESNPVTRQLLGDNVHTPKVERTDPLISRMTLSPLIESHVIDNLAMLLAISHGHRDETAPPRQNHVSLGAPIAWGSTEACSPVVGVEHPPYCSVIASSSFLSGYQIRLRHLTIRLSVGDGA